MATLLVTYDLNKESSRPDILGEIKNYASWAKLSESSYAIVTDEAPAAVYAKMLKHLDSNDDCYVINLRGPYCGQGPVKVNQWLESNLPW